MNPQFIDEHTHVLQHMLTYKEYDLLENYLRQSLDVQDSDVLQLIHIGQAILNVDLDRLSQLVAQTPYYKLTSVSKIHQRVYFFTHYLQTQLTRKQYADYFRALTPVLVDLFRLIVAHDFFEDINDFMVPVVKDTADGKPLYRGLQWHQRKVESTDNIIRQTFQRYYGDGFNYDHYVSSSHLLKLVEDHSANQDLKDKATRIRYIEKYLRNIIAHEVVCVDEAWIQHRVDMSIDDIHHLYIDLVKYAGLTQTYQWEIFDHLEMNIKKLLQGDYYAEISH